MTEEQFVIQMKGAAIKQLLRDELHPYAHLRDSKGRLPKCFVQGHWADYLAPEDLDRTIKYVQENPIKLGLKAQRWPFVTRRE